MHEPTFVDCRHALQAADTLLRQLMTALRATLLQADGDETRALQLEQSRAHGVAWAATYVRVLQQMLAWAQRLHGAGRLGELEVLPNGVFKINSEQQPRENLAKRLKEIYDPRPDKLIFIKGDSLATYQDVIFAMDMARGSGVKVIGHMPKTTP